MNTKFLNHVSVATMVIAFLNILIVIFLDGPYVAFVSAIFAWIIVITTQLSLISVRINRESNRPDQ